MRILEGGPVEYIIKLISYRGIPSLDHFSYYEIFPVENSGQSNSIEERSMGTFTNKYIPKEFLQIRVIWSVFESQRATIVKI